MKFLLFLSHGIYLRHYGDLVRQLSEAGHGIVLAKTTTKELDDSLLHRFGKELTGTEILQLPERSGRWWSVNDPLRAVRDYLRYLDPVFAEAPKLAARGGRRIPKFARALFEGSGLARSTTVRSALDRILALIDRSTPPDPALKEWISTQRAQALLVTPLVDFDYHQLDALKAARSLGLPTCLLVASWDNLTNKGRILLEPDCVVVWNDYQRHEAEVLHNISPDRICVTGAQTFDHWFTMEPRRTREEFHASVGGLDAQKPTILYLCSSAFICEDEVSVVRSWIGALRRSADPRLSTANVLIRPHPAHATQWAGVDLSEGGQVAIWPRTGETPLDDERKQAYFDSLFHSSAVVGINTSAFLEAAIIGRRTLVFRPPNAEDAQDGTLHFRYLLEDGFLFSATGLEEHITQLSDVLRGQDDAHGALQRFITRFLRPHGIDRPALPFLCSAVERVANRGIGEKATLPWWTWIVRAGVTPLAAVVAPQYRSVLERRVRSQVPIQRPIGERDRP